MCWIRSFTFIRLARSSLEGDVALGFHIMNFSTRTKVIMRAMALSSASTAVSSSVSAISSTVKPFLGYFVLKVQIKSLVLLDYRKKRYLSTYLFKKGEKIITPCKKHAYYDISLVVKRKWGVRILITYIIPRRFKSCFTCQIRNKLQRGTVGIINNILLPSDQTWWFSLAVRKSSFCYALASC